MNTRDIRLLKQDIRIERQLGNIPFVFYSTWGLFSPKEIDEGSELLINNVRIDSSDLILDIGCGYGPIGLTLAKRAPQGKVHLVDKDYVAVDYAKKNARANHIENCEVYLSNGFDKIPDVDFDVIVSNLPAKVGKELYWILLSDAKKHLKSNGELYVVTISGLKEFIKRTFHELFGNYEKVAQSPRFANEMHHLRTCPV